MVISRARTRSSYLAIRLWRLLVLLLSRLLLLLTSSTSLCSRQGRCKQWK